MAGINADNFLSLFHHRDGQREIQRLYLYYRLASAAKKGIASFPFFF